MSKISEKLQIFEKFASYEKITPYVKAHITRLAKAEGLDPKSVHAGIKARYKRIHNTLNMDTKHLTPSAKRKVEGIQKILGLGKYKK